MGSGQLLPSKTSLSPTIYFLFFKIFSKRARACILIITDPCPRVGDGGKLVLGRKRLLSGKIDGPFILPADYAIPLEVFKYGYKSRSQHDPSRIAYIIAYISGDLRYP